jgi:hypothetical protein
MQAWTAFRDRLSNLPLRNQINRFSKRARNWLISLIPTAPIEQVSSLLYSAEFGDRWANEEFAPANDSDATRKKQSEETPRSAFVRKYEGKLRVDPASTHIFEGRRMVRGSPDGLTREREPAWVTQIHFPSYQVDEVLSLRGSFEYNYFHFLYDTMRAYLLAKEHIGEHVPVLVGAELERQPFFRAARDRGVFGARQVLVQPEDRVFAARKIYTARAGHPRKADLLQLCDHFGSPPASSGEGRKIYLGRGKAAQNKRSVRNEDDVVAALARRGFERVDTQTLDLGEQMKLFAECACVVAPHGAGLTNILWRRGRPLRVIELINANYYSIDFLYLCRVMGYDHTFIQNQGIVGKPLTSSSVVDIEAVEAALGD